MATIQRKLSPDTIVGKLQRPADGLPVWLYRIAGICNGFETTDDNSKFGEYTRLQGDFRAVNFETGEESVGFSAFLPAGMGELIASRSPTQEKPITVLLDIGIKADPRKEPTDPKGYMYIVRNPQMDRADDPTAKLLTSVPLPDGVKALPIGKGQATLPGM